MADRFTDEQVRAIRRWSVLGNTSTYGPFHGGDPRTYYPDTEECTQAEVDAWWVAAQAADAAAQRGESAELPPQCMVGDASTYTGTGFRYRRVSLHVRRWRRRLRWPGAGGLSTNRARLFRAGGRMSDRWCFLLGVVAAYVAMLAAYVLLHVWYAG